MKFGVNDEVNKTIINVPKKTHQPSVPHLDNLDTTTPSVTTQKEKTQKEKTQKEKPKTQTQKEKPKTQTPSATARQELELIPLYVVSGVLTWLVTRYIF